MPRGVVYHPFTASLWTLALLSSAVVWLFTYGGFR